LSKLRGDDAVRRREREREREKETEGSKQERNV
jgi:hypothetical protein